MRLSTTHQDLCETPKNSGSEDIYTDFDYLHQLGRELPNGNLRSHINTLAKEQISPWAGRKKELKLEMKSGENREN